MTRIASAVALLGSLLTGCTVTNTGNPNTSKGSAPDGVDLVRSSLQRDTHPLLSEADRERFGSDNRQFAFDLYAQVKDGSDNLFFSPYSISVALAMTYAGAEGQTETEMASALHFSLSEPSLHAAFNATDLALAGRAHELLNADSSGDGLKLQITNATFGQKGRTFVDAYLDLLARHYGAGMFLADFDADPERERNAINSWVLKQTEQRIEELLPKGSITPNVALVLVNAIYFKASWLNEFDPERTEPQPFHTSGGDVSVQMMHGSAENYARGEDYQALELPYISNAVRMLFILPDEGQFATVEARLGSELFDEARQALSPHRVELSVPRFNFDAQFRLKPALSALGMKLAFSGADLSGISGPPGDLYIDQVYHKAFVSVDEQGTEAAAATAVVVRVRSVPPPAVFVLDRPFIFLVYDEPTGQILFVGRLTTPTN